DQRAGREIVAEDFATQLGEAVAEPRVGDEHGHRHHVGEAGTGFSERAAEPGEYFVHLPVEIAGQRAAGAILDGHLTREPNDTATLGDDGLRIAAGLCRLALDVTAPHGLRLSLRLW